MDDLKEAMKTKDTTALTVLRALKSAVKYAAIEQHGADGDLDEAGSLAVVRKQIKQRQDSIESFEKAGRDDRAATGRTPRARCRGDFDRIRMWFYTTLWKRCL